MEAVMLGLRQDIGLDLASLRGLGRDIPESAYGKWVRAGMLEKSADSLRLVDEGWLLLDEISADLAARASTPG
jgi:coproporphyrinogen III oxidase-like Fe-S oxidoreductase